MSEEIVDTVDSQVETQGQETGVDSSQDSQYSPQESAAPQQQAAQQPPSPWDAFKRLPDFQGADDRAIAARLYTSMEREKAASRALAQYQQVLPYAQEYLSNRREFEAWRQSQTQQPAPQAAPQHVEPEKPKWWNPPQVKDSYKRYLVKDEDGREIIDPNAPIHAREELVDYQQYKADFARKFLEDPQGALGPMIQEMATKQAQDIVQQQFERAGQEQYVSSVEEENRDWLFDSQTGNVTPEGLLVHKYIEEAREAGIQGPQKRWDYAVAMTERTLLAQAFDQSQTNLQGSLRQQSQQFVAPANAQRQAPPAPPQPSPPQAKQPDMAQQNMQYLRREAARNPSRSGGTASNDPRTPKPKRSFADMLKDEASSRGLI